MIVENLELYDDSRFDINADSPSHVSVRNCEVHGPEGAATYGSAVRARGEDIVVYDNHIHHNWRGGVGGLAIGMACCILIYFFVRDELTYDDFHTHIDTMYRVEGNLLQGHRLPIMSGPVQGAMIAAFPEIERAVRLNDAKAVVERGTNRFEETLLFADPGFLEMFTFPLRRGEDAQALQDPLSVVLSNEMAHMAMPNLHRNRYP